MYFMKKKVKRKEKGRQIVNLNHKAFYSYKRFTTTDK